MTSALERYYATNYSKCSLEYNFLASWQGVAYPSHVVQVISLPFQILAFYVILFKTPTSMKNVKSPLLINHFCCALLDITLCTCCAMYYFVPMYGMLFVGILSWLRVPNVIQLLIVWWTVIFAATSYLYLFESRSSSLVQNKFRMTNQKKRLIYYCFFLFPWILFCFCVKLIPQDQDAAKLSALEDYPCPTREFFTSDVVIAIADKILKEASLWIILFFLIYVSTFPLFQVITLIYYICIAPSKTSSQDTQKKQKVFLYCILFQCSIPLFLAAFPACFIFIIYVTGHYSQEIVNISFINFACHGLGESIAIVTVHRPYRQAVGQMINALKKNRRSIQVLPYHDNQTRDSLTRG